jgi:hypothetical protein
MWTFEEVKVLMCVIGDQVIGIHVLWSWAGPLETGRSVCLHTPRAVVH